MWNFKPLSFTIRQQKKSACSISINKKTERLADLNLFEQSNDYD